MRLALLFLGCLTSAQGLSSQVKRLGSLSSAPIDSFVPTFTAPQLTPRQFLFVSSPAEQKIVYTELRNFQSTSGRTFVLVDSGLSKPAGLAFDHQRGNLYVADGAFKKIFRFTVFVDETGPTTKLVTDGVQLTILENTTVQWVAVDAAGNVIYSDEDAKTINKIPADTVELLASGELEASDLVLTSVADQETRALIAAARRANSSGAAATSAADTSLPQASILVLYEASSNPSVVAPAGLATDGIRLYWTNSAGGQKGGTAVQGEMMPQQLVQLEPGSTPFFRSVSLTNATDGATGVVRSNNMLFYSSSSDGNGAVYGITESGKPLAFVQGLSSPMGLVWDGDQTVFVADTAQNTVYSFPIGRVSGNVPLTRSVVLSGATGLALLSAQDPAFQLRAEAAKTAFAVLSWLMLLMLTC